MGPRVSGHQEVGEREFVREFSDQDKVERVHLPCFQKNLEMRVDIQ